MPSLVALVLLTSTVFGFNIVPESHAPTRRDFLASSIATASILTSSSPARAASTNDAAITDKVFIEFKGITTDKERIVIGLFGNDAPQPVSILKQLVSKEGYKTKCKPLDTSRVLQKEQLEANKVYNSCMENEVSRYHILGHFLLVTIILFACEKLNVDTLLAIYFISKDTQGVNYDYSSVWRVIPNQRIDVGAVSGKFVARENPNFEDTKSSSLRHDSPGVVSVRRGNDGGFGFTIYPGGNANSLDEDNIVVGRVIEGMDVVQKLNDIPVVKSALAGGAGAKNAPSRACRYGGSELYCNENKPLKKVLIENTGIL